MNSGELLGRFRQEVVDLEAPYLWSDEEVFAYINDAYFTFARFTGGISDVTGSATKLSITAGTDEYDLDPSILRIMDAWRESDGETVKVVNFTDLPGINDGSDYGALKRMTRKNTPGPVKWVVIGMQENHAKVLGIPLVDDIIAMQIYRLPSEKVTDENHALNEVAEHHHEHLLKWVKHRAYSKEDAETFDKSKSKDNEDAFRAYCFQCKAEWERKKHKPRVVAYGGL